MGNTEESVGITTPEDKMQVSTPKKFTDHEPMAVGELYKQKFSPDVWLVDGLIPADGITMIYGALAAYKTRLTVDIVKAIVTGKPWLDRFTTTKTKVLFIDQENGPKRMQRLLKELGITQDLPVLIRSRHNFIVNEENVGHLLQECSEHGIGLVVFDPFVLIHDGNENDTRDMTRVMRWLLMLVDAGIAVIFLHHTRKPDLSENTGRFSYRGSSVLEGEASAALHLELDKDNTLTLMQRKKRDKGSNSSFTIEVLDTVEHLQFKYGKALKGQAKADEDIKAICDKTKELLSEGRILNQTELVAELKAIFPDITISDKNIEKLLWPLLKDWTLTVERGPRKALLYSIAKESSDEAPVSKAQDEPVYEEIPDESFTQEDFDEVMSGSFFSS